MSDDALLLSAGDGPHLRLTLNRPDKRNALSGELVAALAEAVEREAAAPAPRIILLAGNGPAFSAGADLALLKNLATRSRGENLADSRALVRLFTALMNHPAPVIALIHGPALAGGCGLATACDLALAAPEASFGYPEVKVGFVAAIVMPLLVRGIGERRARELLLTGKTIDAAEARHLGLVHELVPADRLAARGRALADELHKNSPTALALTKRALRDIAGLDLPASLDRGATLNAEVRATPDLLEGVTAFLAKREPVWPSRKP